MLENHMYEKKRKKTKKIYTHNYTHFEEHTQRKTSRSMSDARKRNKNRKQKPKNTIPTKGCLSRTHTSIQHKRYKFANKWIWMPFIITIFSLQSPRFFLSPLYSVSFIPYIPNILKGDIKSFELLSSYHQEFIVFFFSLFVCCASPSFSLIHHLHSFYEFI